MSDKKQDEKFVGLVKNILAWMDKNRVLSALVVGWLLGFLMGLIL